MHVHRFLGSAWATVHGPSDPRRLLVSVLEARFAGLSASPGPRAVDWASVRAAAEGLPVRFAAVRASNPLAEPSVATNLASSKDSERQAALRAVQQAAGIARQLGCPTVIVDVGLVPVLGEVEAEDLGDPNHAWTTERAQPLLARRKVGRNGAVDRVCRELFGLRKSLPEFQFAVTQSRSLRAVADVPALQDVFEDLGERGVGYWHDAALAARREQVLGEAQGEWLEAFANRCMGLTLGDASGGGLYLPPGAGGVDYGLLANYVPRTGNALPVVLELDVSIPSGELAGIRSFLDKHGL